MATQSYTHNVKLSDRTPPVLMFDTLQQDVMRAQQEEEMGSIAIDTARWELQAKKEAWEAQKKQADVSGQLATQFLSAWGGAMTDLKGMFGQAGQALTSVTQLLSESGKMPDEMKGYLGEITNLQNLVRDQYKAYQAETAPVQRELWKAAQEEIAGRRTLTQRLLEAGEARPEDAAMRAGTDAKIQAELGEREAARELMSMGVDPSAGRFGALSRRSAIQTAGEQAKAMNLARAVEKNRAAQVNLATMGQLNPGQLTAAGAALSSEGTKMLGTSADIARTGADIYGRQQAIDLQRLQGLTQLGTAYGSLAGQYANAVTAPYGELAGYYLGKAGGAINPAGLGTGPALQTPTASAPTTTYATGNASRNIALGQATSGNAASASQQANYLYGIDTAEPKYY